MYGRSHTPDTPSPWLVRAEVTIRRSGDQAVALEPRNSSTGCQEAAGNGGVQMVYKWGRDPGDVERNPAGSYAFQRGNILFTSTPPPRPFSGSSTTPATSAPRHLGVNVSDSGYNSEQFSPQSYSSLPHRRPCQQYNRRCKSTCSIVLSTAEEPRVPDNANPQCTDRFCGHHAKSGFFKPVPEACEDCLEGITSGRKAFTTHFCTRVPGRSHGFNPTTKGIHCSNDYGGSGNSKDAASQTTDVQTQTSFSSVPSLLQGTNFKHYETRRKTAPGLLRKFNERDFWTGQQEKKEVVPGSSSSSLSVGVTSEKSNIPPIRDSQSETTGAANSSGKEDTAKRKSRTVHIDVYCTGSEEEDEEEEEEDEDEAEDSSYSDSSEASERLAEKPRTIFESDRVRVTHSRAEETRLPRGLQDDKAFLKRSEELSCESFKQAPMRMPSLASSRGYETDDVLSSLYPSQFSSYSRIRDLDSTPWSAASSCVGLNPHPDSYDSATATSWKDTISDVESLLNSKSGLTPCDSFEYANSSDRERIGRLETAWDEDAESREKRSKTWRSPQIERRQLLQNRKMKEFLDKHQVGWSSPESAAESDDSAELGWSFVSSDENSRHVRRDSTVRRPSKEAQQVQAPSREPEDRGCMSDTAGKTTLRGFKDQIGPFGAKSPSPARDKVESRVTSPFTTPQGEKTDHILKASVFGAVVGAFRKPGHHIGPSKNPSCSCEHCRRFFEEDAGPRGRSRSLGDIERRPGAWIRRNKDIISQAPRNSKNGVS
ncbi:uncharacterized protein LOC124404388 [Diprion similis]|uniref:uncharacterized protein LOC124404388 n=1 Tax=Diprion similis TaxID=362088 RepID=UPI001EF8C594|nr:uncharacterized protein LOC124404388 [Diprion similis]